MDLHARLAENFAATLADQAGPAQLAQVAGREVRIVVDKPAMTTVDAHSGLLLSRMQVYILRDDLGYAPPAGSALHLDGQSWTVEIPSPHGGGVLQLGLVRHLG